MAEIRKEAEKSEDLKHTVQESAATPQKLVKKLFGRLVMNDQQFEVRSGLSLMLEWPL